MFAAFLGPLPGTHRRTIVTAASSTRERVRSALPGMTGVVRASDNVVVHDMAGRGWPTGRAPAGSRVSGHTRWLLLPVEVKARGFEGRVLLGAHAAARGWKVVVGQKHALNANLPGLPRGLYVDKGIQRFQLPQIRITTALGNTYVGVDEEGLVHEGGATTYVKRRYSTETLAATGAFCAWGEHQADVMRTATPELADRIVVTGNPRVDLWRREMHGLHREAVERIRTEVGPFVLFPSNFANVMGADGPQHAEQFGVLSGQYDDPDERRRFGDYLALRRGILDRLAVALPRLAQELPPSHSLVVRPHPSEDHEVWARIAAGEPRLHVRYDGPLTPWMLASDGVVHSNCTTGVEAAVAGIPAIAYAPLDESAFPMLPNQVSVVVDDDDALVDAVGSMLAGRPVVPESALATVRRHIAALDGPFAAERMVDVFDTLPVRADRGDGRLGHRRVDAAQVLVERVRRRRRGSQPATVRPPSETLARQKFAPTPVSEPQRFLARLAEVDPRVAGVSASEVAPSLFQLEATDG
jgi:surface carbohydrate biosynthesis protein